MTTDLEAAKNFIHGQGIDEQLVQQAAEQPEHVYAVENGKQITLAELEHRVASTAACLERLGIGRHSRVAIALPTTVQHASLILALFRLGALWVPLNSQMRGDPLRHQVQDAEVTHYLVPEGADFMAQLADVTGQLRSRPVVDGVRCLDKPGASAAEPLPGVALLMYTSGTTGPPKGVQVTWSMLRAAVLGTLDVTEAQDDDVFYLWEPLFHIGGAQAMLVPLYRRVTLVFVPRFSASRFWSDVRHHGVTHIHYLGGVLQILLQLPPSEDEQASRVRVAWGAGATPALWEASRQRFGFVLHECYGMTETSSIVSVNRNRPDGGVGHPLPWFRVETVPYEPVDNAAGKEGKREIAVQGHMGGLITPGYLNRSEATAGAWRDGWFHTGDLGLLDDAGTLHFAGRGSDSIRVRGENVSAWQVEEIFTQHPGVERAAVLGVKAEIGEEEMMLFVVSEVGETLDAAALLRWAGAHLAKYQLPRFVKQIQELPLTPSQRVAKHRLPVGTADAYDALADSRR